MARKLTKYGTLKAAIREPHNDEQHYIPVGVVFSDEEGRLVLKINSLPRDPNLWHGWLYINEDNAPEAA